jgi:serine/threonine-protein kinase
MTGDLRGQLQSSLGEAYTVETEIGGGGMSRVYVAEDRSLHRRIVVKVLPPELAGGIAVSRFQREITLAARLQHPHIVPLLASGEMQGLPYYTMPFVDGESLRQRLDRAGELPVAEAVRLLREIASALAYAHDNGIVHRDIKPANVLLSGGISLVADFGVAKALMASATTGESLTSTGIAIGTPAYMSPEQVAADPSVDHRADLYSFGMLAYEMLAGRPPFVGRSPHELLSAHVLDAPEPLETRRAGVPSELAALVMRCLAKRPDDRPKDAHAIVRALDALVTPSETVAPRARAARRVSRLGLAAGVGVLIAAAGATWFAFTHRSRAAAAENRLVVAPFTNLTGNPAFDNVGRIAADQLTATVAATGAIDVVESNFVLQVLRDTTHPVPERIQRLAEAAHARFIVTGSVALRGDSLQLRGQLAEVGTGKVVTVFDPVMSASSDAIAALNVLGDHLIGALRVGRWVQHAQRGYRAPSYAAQEEFDKGMELFALRGDSPGAIPFFKQAIALDSTFTRAYLLLEQQYLNTSQFKLADSLMQRVERLPQRLTDGERLLHEFHKTELNGDYSAQLQALQRLAAHDSSAISLVLAGRVANYLLRPDLAVPAIEAGEPAYLAIGGWTRGQVLGPLVEAYHQAGMHDRELRATIDLPAKYPDLLRIARMPRLRAYAGLRQGTAALALADTTLRESSDSSGIALSVVAITAPEFRAHGDTATATALLVMARGWIAAHPVRTPTPIRQTNEGYIFLLDHIADSAVVRFASVVRQKPGLTAIGLLAVAQAMAGDRVHAQTTADSLGALSGPGEFSAHGYWQAAIVATLGDRARAVQLLQKARDNGETMFRWHYDAPLDALHGYPAFEELVRPTRR